jgi:hypothetical protein
MPRFRIKELLLSTALVTLGLAAFDLYNNETWRWLCVYSLPLICAGLFLPFNRAWLGLGFGFLLWIALFIAFVGFMIVWHMLHGFPT